MLQNILKNKKLVITLTCLSLLYITWGMVYLSIKFALESFPPVMLSGMRYCAAGSCILFWVFFIKKEHGLPTIYDVKVMAISAFGMIVISGAFLNMSEKYIPSGVVALILGSTPIWMVLSGWLFGYDKRPSVKVFIGLGGGFLGVILLTVSIGFEIGGSLLGIFCIFASMSGWVAGSLYSKEHHAKLSLFKSLGFQMIMGGCFMIFVSFITGEMDSFSVSAVTLKSFLSYLHLVFFGSIVGFSCYTWLLYNTPTPVAVSYAYAEPVIAVILGTLFAGEQIYSATIASCLLIVVSVFFVMSTKRK